MANDTGNAALEQCVLGVVGGLTFPAAEPGSGEVAVSYPFSFKADVN